MVQVVLHLVVLRQARQVSVLHLHQVFHLACKGENGEEKKDRKEKGEKKIWSVSNCLFS